MSQGKWVAFNENFDEGVRNNYEIFDTYPHNIRKKDTKRILTFGLNPYGYYHCTLNKKLYRVHRIIALQWIPNDDPANKTEVDHINRVRTDYHIENLRWVDHVGNMLNRDQPAVVNRITKKELHAFIWWLIDKHQNDNYDKWHEMSNYKIQKIYKEETSKFIHLSTINNNRDKWYVYHGQLVKP